MTEIGEHNRKKWRKSKRRKFVSVAKGSDRTEARAELRVNASLEQWLNSYFLYT